MTLVIVELNSLFFYLTDLVVKNFMLYIAAAMFVLFNCTVLAYSQITCVLNAFAMF